MTPTLKNLQYLIALKKTNHFSKAASECFVSPSTFSAGISKLEQDLEILLVERDNKNVAFTPIGKRIVNQAMSVMTEMTTLVETAKLDFFESEVFNSFSQSDSNAIIFNPSYSLCKIENE